MRRILSKYGGMIPNVLLGLLNLTFYIYGTHQPISLAAAGFCFGLALSQLMLIGYQRSSNDLIGKYRGVIISKDSQISSLEKIIDDVASGRATLFKKDPVINSKMN